MVSRSSINKASVPAKVIAKVAFQRDTVENNERERYYILDSEYEAASVMSTLRNGPQMAGRLVQVMREAEGGKEKGSPSSMNTLQNAVTGLENESEEAR
jgi:PHD/YefM family antitoxin component YafN of YafNO toxin-antitoxin module